MLEGGAGAAGEFKDHKLRMIANDRNKRGILREKSFVSFGAQCRLAALPLHILPQFHACLS